MGFPECVHCDAVNDRGAGVCYRCGASLAYSGGPSVATTPASVEATPECTATSPAASIPPGCERRDAHGRRSRQRLGDTLGSYLGFGLLSVLVIVLAAELFERAPGDRLTSLPRAVATVGTNADVPAASPTGAAARGDDERDVRIATVSVASTPEPVANVAAAATPEPTADVTPASTAAPVHALAPPPSPAPKIATSAIRPPHLAPARPKAAGAVKLHRSGGNVRVAQAVPRSDPPGSARKRGATGGRDADRPATRIAAASPRPLASTRSRNAAPAKRLPATLPPRIDVALLKTSNAAGLKAAGLRLVQPGCGAGPVQPGARCDAE
jgi:hypothetical protein